jgi:hypothetical protein
VDSVWERERYGMHKVKVHAGGCGFEIKEKYLWRRYFDNPVSLLVLYYPFFIFFFEEHIIALIVH